MEKTIEHDGKTYTFKTLPIKGDKFPELPAESGVYVIGKEEGGKCEPLYIGQSVDFAKRIGDKAHREEALKKGANIIGFAEAPREVIADLENKLVAKFNPPLNGHWK